MTEVGEEVGDVGRFAIVQAARTELGGHATWFFIAEGARGKLVKRAKVDKST